MTWRKILPNLFTLGALACAVLSILHAAHGEYLVAAQLIMLCLILDGFDGNVARLFKGETQFGAEVVQGVGELFPLGDAAALAGALQRWAQNRDLPALRERLQVHLQQRFSDAVVRERFWSLPLRAMLS